MPCKTPRPGPPARRSAIVLQLELDKYAVAVWRRDEDGESGYEILNDNIREVKIAATLARTVESELERS